MKNIIQLIKKLLSLGLRNEGFRWIWIEVKFLDFWLFPLELSFVKLKYLKSILTWAQKGNPKDELSLSKSKDATMMSPDIVK